MSLRSDTFQGQPARFSLSHSLFALLGNMAKSIPRFSSNTRSTKCRTTPPPCLHTVSPPALGLSKRHPRNDLVPVRKQGTQLHLSLRLHHLWLASLVQVSEYQRISANISVFRNFDALTSSGYPVRRFGQFQLGLCNSPVGCFFTPVQRAARTFHGHFRPFLRQMTQPFARTRTRGRRSSSRIAVA